MAYCNPGVQAIVSYSFNGKPSDRFTTNKTPIEVIQEHEGTNFTGGQCKCMTYVVTATVVQSDREPFEIANNVFGEIINTKILRTPESEVFFNGDPNECFASFQMLCRGLDNGAEGCQAEYVWREVWGTLNCKLDVNLVNIKISPRYPNQVDNCGDPPLGKCTIKVNHANQTIFSVSGDSPCNYTVACGEECPEGFLKCESTSYPGYCCISCNELKAQVIATKIAAKMKNQYPVSR